MKMRRPVVASKQNIKGTKNVQVLHVFFCDTRFTVIPAGAYKTKPTNQTNQTNTKENTILKMLPKQIYLKKILGSKKQLTVVSGVSKPITNFTPSIESFRKKQPLPKKINKMLTFLTNSHY